MPEYVVTRNGRKFDVEADDPDSAEKLVSQKFKEEKEKAVAAKKEEISDALPWGKRDLIRREMGKVAADTYTMSVLPWLLDKTMGTNMQQQVDVARDVLGPGALPVDVAAGMANPINLVKTGARLGGGKVARGVIGMLAGGTQGAIEGGISAATRGEPIPTGVGIGMASGIGGVGASNIASGIGNRAAKWWSGIDDKLPPLAPSAKQITPAGKVEQALYEASVQPGGGSQTSLRSAIAPLRLDKTYKNKPEVLAQMDEVIKGDPATQGAKGISKAAYALTLPSSASLSLGGNVLGGAATMVGLPAVGLTADLMSKQGTKESVENLRRMLLNHPKYKGILDRANTSRLGAGLRATTRQELEEELGY